MKTLSRTLLLGVAALSFAGCGGGGSPKVVVLPDPIDPYLSGLAKAFREKSITQVEALVSDGYMNDCANKEDMMRPLRTAFSMPFIVRFDFEVLSVTNRVVDHTRGKATFDARVKVTVQLADGSSSSEESLTSNYLIREGTQWRDHGNQECGTARPSRTRSILDFRF